MPTHEMVDRFVPGSPVCADARAIPPLSVKLPVAKLHNFGKSIENGLEDCKKAS